MAPVTFLAIVVLSGMPYTAPGPSYGHYAYAAPSWSSCKTCRGRSGQLYDYRIEFDYPWRMSPLPTVPHDYACPGCAPHTAPYDAAPYDNGPYRSGPYENGPHGNVPYNRVPYGAPHDARLRQPGPEQITSRDRARLPRTRTGLTTRVGRAPTPELRPAAGDSAIK